MLFQETKILAKTFKINDITNSVRFYLFRECSIQLPSQRSCAQYFGCWRLGCSSNTKDSVKDIKNKNPQLVLALGDFSYQKTAKCWFNIIKPIDKITKINIGNHDDESKSLLNSYLSHFDSKKQY